MARRRRKTRRSFSGRTGTPMYSARYRTHVFVTVDCPGKPITMREWSGGKVANIKKAAKAHYPGCKLRFGRSFSRAV